MLTGANEDLTSEQVIDALLHTIKGVLQKHSWASAFAKNGFGSTFEVREHLLEVLAWQTPPNLASELPSYTDFAHCFPRRYQIPIHAVAVRFVAPASQAETSTEGDNRGRK